MTAYAVNAIISLVKKADCPKGGKVETMKITKEMVAKHIMNQTEISEPFDETKKCAMAFCYSEGSNIVFKDVWEEELKEWGHLTKMGVMTPILKALKMKTL